MPQQTSTTNDSTKPTTIARPNPAALNIQHEVLHYLNSLLDIFHSLKDLDGEWDVFKRYRHASTRVASSPSWAKEERLNAEYTRADIGTDIFERKYLIFSAVNEMAYVMRAEVREACGDREDVNEDDECGILRGGEGYDGLQGLRNKVERLVERCGRAWM